MNLGVHEKANDQRGNPPHHVSEDTRQSLFGNSNIFEFVIIVAISESRLPSDGNLDSDLLESPCSSLGFALIAILKDTIEM